MITSPTPALDRITADVNATMDLLETLRAVKSDIAAYRRAGLHPSATSLRDDTLNRLENWLDPDAIPLRHDAIHRSIHGQIDRWTAKALADGVDGPGA